MRCALLCALLVAVSSASAQTPAPSAALAEYAQTCDRGRALWGRSLCGPIALVERASRRATTNHPGLDRYPDSLPLANTAVTWQGERWTIVLLPLPSEHFERIRLLHHEAFHRIQPDLGLTTQELPNGHLESAEGRIALRLELRALAAALRAPDDGARRRAARDALAFRATRRAAFPGAGPAEDALERQEGLAEYTGVRLALDITGADLSRAAEHVESFQDRKAYARSFAYATGPAWGLLLDRYAPRWRERAREASLDVHLAAALGRERGGESMHARLARYDGAALRTVEEERARETAARVARLRALLVDGPVVVMRQQQLNGSFDPNTAVVLEGEGTVYPGATFRAEWGELRVTGEGLVLLSPDWQVVRLPAPAGRDAPITGEGWTLTLNEGWHVVPGERPGDWTLRRP